LLAQPERRPAVDERSQLAVGQRARIGLTVAVVLDRRWPDLVWLALMFGQL